MLGRGVVEEVVSPINGRIKVVRSLGMGTYIQVENLTQSGGIVKNIWNKTLRKVKSVRPKILTCLILGLGGGTASLLVRKFWPKVQITGVDIDPFIVELGRKYLGLKGLKVVIFDAYDFVKKVKKKYDLILIDTYIGYEFPKKFEEEEFLKAVRSLLDKEGMAVFNRLYMAEKRPQAVKFGEKLDTCFNRVERVYPEANIIFLCYN
jgi:spermidine synthase